ncbi:MAG: FHA domain-containing protein [Anaerolineae bacterium]|nr:FHA domain-containing protein [Anaerolineae bacterium]
MNPELNFTIMSGVDDGSMLRCSPDQGDGKVENETWMISIGRHDNNDICLNNDTFVSRHHARIHLQDQHLWLEDRDSTNGTYIEVSPHEDVQVVEKTPLSPGQLFRVGRTWLRIEPLE